MPKPSIFSRVRTRVAQFVNGGKLPEAQADTSWERIQISIRLRFNPIRDLTPDKLATYLDNFRLGWFRWPALTWDAMERRDPRLMTVAPKRKKAVARRGWEIVASDDSPAALQQKEKLEYFYKHLCATTALEGNEKGGMGLLVKQMMDAIGKRYAAHEIVWQPGPDGLTAQFVFCPLWWFEGTRGVLRYLQNETSIYGEDLEPDGWLITVGEGIMEACSVAYMFKHMPLQNWVSFSEKFGMPGVIGKTDAQIDSPEWNALADAVKSISSDWAAVVKAGTIDLLEVKNAGQLPFQPLVDMMSEEMTRLWTGSDLGTSSKANAVGASLQGDASDLLEEDDAKWISETLNEQVSKFVLKYYFGPDVEQLAHVQIKTPQKDNIDQEIKIDQFLVDAGAPLAVNDVLERYNRPQPDAGEELLKNPTPPPMPGAPVPDPADPEDPAADPEIANAADALLAASRSALVHAINSDLQPVMDRMNAIFKITDPDAAHSAWKNFLTWLDKFRGSIQHDPATAHALEEITSAALANGLAAKGNKS